MLIISHDRAFLRRLADRTLWLERGELRRLNAGIDEFPDWADRVLADEEAQAHKLNRKITEETPWLREGLTARRKRNMSRVRSLLGLQIGSASCRVSVCQYVSTWVAHVSFKQQTKRG